ncbi:hypothetical protein SCUP515_10103 [Seiridium cupressi]
MDPIESVARECDENLTLSKQLQQLQYTESAMDSAGEAANPNGRPAVFRSLAQEVLFVITTTFTIAMPSFLQGSILIVGPAIQRDLSMATAELTWMMASSSSGNHLGFVFSAIISGIVTEEFGWPAAFWLIAALYLVVAIIACFTVPSDDGEKLPLNMESLKQFDFVGAFLTITGIGLFTVALSVGPDAPNGWKTPYIIVFIVLGPALLAVFIWWEMNFQHPLMPMHIWRDREFSLVN